jgi:antitoxin MazE
MKTHLRQLGNSKAVLLPSAMLTASGLGDQIELTAEPGCITIKPVKASREGWYEGYVYPKNDRSDTDLLSDLDADGKSTDEWEW